MISPRKKMPKHSRKRLQQKAQSESSKPTFVTMKVKKRKKMRPKTQNVMKMSRQSSPK